MKSSPLLKPELSLIKNTFKLTFERSPLETMVLDFCSTQKEQTSGFLDKKSDLLYDGSNA
ncbi:MAG: hypothetical protein K5798_01815 [Nitrosopumilus sp.]|uniref:hypothetical protein n=1 Tax=Nitrosopumilus sp. TaxID=2024843 RepID=UPI0024319F45|nr:hypothetical protein [Nitrosopumilus sp.]MCV0365988.1 hypothetical protein [Nitrosopumilus sp.]